MAIKRKKNRNQNYNQKLCVVDSFDHLSVKNCNFLAFIRIIHVFVTNRKRVTNSRRKFRVFQFLFPININVLSWANEFQLSGRDFTVVFSYLLTLRNPTIVSKSLKSSISFKSFDKFFRFWAWRTCRFLLLVVSLLQSIFRKAEPLRSFHNAIPPKTTDRAWRWFFVRRIFFFFQNSVCFQNYRSESPTFLKRLRILGARNRSHTPLERAKPASK